MLLEKWKRKTRSLSRMWVSLARCSLRRLPVVGQCKPLGKEEQQQYEWLVVWFVEQPAHTVGRRLDARPNCLPCIRDTRRSVRESDLR